ncbi:hypothetical protein QFZ81_001423 [Paenibacillus sp. V4I9]|uniref:hypothetical protein n=1 Tax=Paenibacillus sp. V4I9 TaxID=3042308 RepID=UPI0027897716|nr:hypothetical protein [Paenibacillus sp. V4I9]MDQ0886335.1 hypothetical protein [Paenibacillus sp. V4I9]
MNVIIMPWACGNVRTEMNYFFASKWDPSMMKLPPSLGPLHVCGFESKPPQHTYLRQLIGSNTSLLIKNRIRL